MSIDAGVWLDSLLVASLAGGAVLLAANLIAGATAISARLRHRLLITALGSCALLPLVLTLLAPAPIGCLTESCALTPVGSGAADRHHAFRAAGKFSDLSAAAAAAAVTAPATAGARPRAGQALVVWAAGAFLVLGLFGRRRWRAARRVREAKAIADPRLTGVCRRRRRDLGITRPVPLLRHPRVRVPAVTGAFRPVLFLPAGLESEPAAEVDMIVLHELAHIRRGDPLTSLVIELIAALLWFHPLVWWSRSRARRWREAAADSVVLEAGVKPSSYADCLLRTFRALAEPADAALVPAHFLLGTGPLPLRLRAILDPRTVHTMPSRQARLGVTFAMGLSALGLSLLPALALAPSPPGEKLEIDRSLLNSDALDALLRPVFIDTMADRYIAGAAISIVHEGRVVYQSGFGHREVYSEEPVDAAKTIFRIGSITKVMTAVAVLQLVDRGLLDLDADVNRYLSAFRVRDTFDQPVRVRHLLTHTAGFDQIGLGRHAASAREVRPLGEFLADGNLVRIRPPGEISCYDTYAITLAGYLVERVSGLSYEEYLRRNVFLPLRMTRSGITVPESLEPDVAVGYEFRGNWFPQDWEFMNTDPASTVNSTVADMARFAAMLLGEGELDGARILETDTVEAMLTRQHTNHPDHSGYGFGFFEDSSYGVPAFSHGGSMSGYGAMLYLVPDFDLGVYLSYTQESGALIEPVLGKLIGALFPDRPPHRELRPRIEPGDIARFAGSYASNTYHHTDPATGWRRRPFEIEVEGEALSFQGAKAHRVGRLDFQRDDGLLLSFRQDAEGRISHLFVNQAVYERLD